MSTRGHDAQASGGSCPGSTTTPRPSWPAASEIMVQGSDWMSRWASVVLWSVVIRPAPESARQDCEGSSTKTGISSVVFVW